MMKSFFLIAITLVLSSCSVTKSSETCIYNDREINCADMPGRNSKAEDENSRYQFHCNNETCDSRTQYCLRLNDYTGHTQTMGCRTKESTCNSCYCLRRQSQKNYPATCSTEPTCTEYSGSIVAVTCQAQ